MKAEYKLVRLARDMNRKKAKVENWRRENPLSTDGQSPYWPSYKKARDAFRDAVNEITD